MTDSTAAFALLIGYKTCVLAAGVALSFMGYRLFMADKTTASGDLAAGAGKYHLSLKGGAPGVFFSLFGAVIICISVFRGVYYDATKSHSRPTAVETVIPDTPPDSAPRKAP